MIRHLLKIIWNEKKTNAWILLEFIVVFCILWFCVDYFYFIGKSYFESPGYDDNHTYRVMINANYFAPEADKETKSQYLATMLSHIRQYPGVEAVGVSQSGMPYSWSTYGSRIKANADSVWHSIQVRSVTPSFFEVFRIRFTKGVAFSEHPSDRQMVIFPDRHGRLGEYPDAGLLADTVREIFYQTEHAHTITGITTPVRTRFDQAFYSGIYTQFDMNEGSPDSEISLRVTPEADEGFADRFVKDLKSSFAMGRYSLGGIRSIRELKEDALQWEINRNTKSVAAITLFLIANIFLGIIGTFWSRIQSRRPEIGLRIAMGSSKRGVRGMLYGEMLLMLFLASILSTYICLNLGEMDILEGLGIPIADRVMAGMGAEQDLINYVITFGFLALVSGLAVWFPARLSTKIQPAEALREE